MAHFGTAMHPSQPSQLIKVVHWYLLELQFLLTFVCCLKWLLFFFLQKKFPFSNPSEHIVKCLFEVKWSHDSICHNLKKNVVWKCFMMYLNYLFYFWKKNTMQAKPGARHHLGFCFPPKKFFTNFHYLFLIAQLRFSIIVNVQDDSSGKWKKNIWNLL